MRESVGPASTEDVIASLRLGETKPDTLVCRVGETNWQTLSLVPEFAEAVRDVAPTPIIIVTRDADNVPFS